MRTKMRLPEYLQVSRKIYKASPSLQLLTVVPPTAAVCTRCRGGSGSDGHADYCVNAHRATLKRGGKACNIPLMPRHAQALYEEYDADDATAAAEADWARDCRGSEGLEEELFKDAIFELAEVTSGNVSSVW